MNDTTHWTLQISAGAGPVEVQRFVRLLADELTAHCRSLGLEITSVSCHGDDDAPRSVEVDVAARASVDARRLLASQLGTHVLVARSASRGKRARKRWFAGVSLYATPAAIGPVVLDLAKLDITAARAGGPGGQHVNKASTAIRIFHKPTGISVRAAGQRSQAMNRKSALARLAAILGRIGAAKASQRHAARRLAHYRFERGSAVQQWRLSHRGDALCPMQPTRP